jgi:hypothetical protein
VAFHAPRSTARARKVARQILDALEAESLPPSRLLPSAEGGISISFVERENRAEIEICNSGEVAVATYSISDDPVVWELSLADSELGSAIHKIRVHLAA